MSDSTVAAPPRRRGVPVWAQVIVWAVLVGLLVLVAIALKRSQQGTVQPGDKIPDFSMPLFSGYELNGKSQVELADLRGKVVVINFWASWCPPCRAEFPHLVAIHKEYKNKDFVLLSMHFAEAPERGKAFASTEKAGFPIYQGATLAGPYEVSAIPVTFFIDKTGKARYRATDFDQHKGEAQFKSIIDELLKEAPAK